MLLVLACIHKACCCLTHADQDTMSRASKVITSMQHHTLMIHCQQLRAHGWQRLATETTVPCGRVVKHNVSWLFRLWRQVLTPAKQHVKNKISSAWLLPQLTQSWFLTWLRSAMSATTHCLLWATHQCACRLQVQILLPGPQTMAD